jgi:two-component system, OmpR family, copper resistance phosphate regulon response regulator CusR
MLALIIEDDRATANVLAQGLNEAGFRVDVAHDGKNGLMAAEKGNHDVILLDINVPRIDGWRILESLRRTKTTPVLVLTGQGTVEEKVRGLRAGADDYVVKPFALVELLARVHSLVRRSTATASTGLRVADLELDTVERCATRNGKRIRLTAKEFALLHLFMRRCGEPLSRAMIAREVWGIDFDTDTNVVEVAVRRLRVKVDDGFDAKLIHTLTGVGYVMEQRAG